jgi:hypothetical protein
VDIEWEEERRRVRQMRIGRGLLPDGGEPVYVEDYLVEVWRLHAAGRDGDARLLFAGVWGWAMDNANQGFAPVALRLLDRLGFVTDDPEAWQALQDELVVYRAESNVEEPDRGFSWTLDKEIAAMHAARHRLSVSVGRVAKRDVLAYITRRGEAEIVVHRSDVRC